MPVSDFQAHPPTRVWDFLLPRQVCFEVAGALHPWTPCRPAKILYFKNPICCALIAQQAGAAIWGQAPKLHAFKEATVLGRRPRPRTPEAGRLLGRAHGDRGAAPKIDDSLNICSGSGIVSEKVEKSKAGRRLSLPAEYLSLNLLSWLTHVTFARRGTLSGLGRFSS